VPNTPILGITYPAGLPGVAPDPAGDIHTVATSAETGIVARYDPARAGTTDSGWTLTPATLATGWGSRTDPNGDTANVKGGVRKVGQRVEVRIRATRTGSAITPGATGNFADVPIMTLASGYIPASTVYGTFVLPGATGGVCRVQTDGVIQITNAFNAASTIGNGDLVQIQVDFFIN
jgi:hypothetical protein